LKQFVGAGGLISDITRMDELVPEASLPERASKVLCVQSQTTLFISSLILGFSVCHH
jgi:hypothetical protein